MSADILDNASDLEQREREISINAARAMASDPVLFFTHCQWCGDPTADGEKFCCYGKDSCAEDFNRRDELLKRQGL